MVTARSSCGREELLDPFDRQPVPKGTEDLAAALDVKVPLLSQEGLTCCLLPGAAAPYPALDQV